MTSRRPLCALLCIAAAAAGEIGPAEVAVVYNADSWASRSVAQAWMRLRGLDPEQAVGLPGLPFGESMPLPEARERILLAIERVLDARGLARRIQVVAYGPDLPWALPFRDGPQAIGRYGPASLTGMTLLAPLIAAGPEAYTAPDANPYAERLDVPGDELERRAGLDPRSAEAMARFTAKDPAGAEAVLRELAADLPAPGVLYNLACALGLQGRSDEAVAALSAAVTAGWFAADLAEGDSDLAALRALPAWEPLLQRMRDLAETIRPAATAGFAQLPAGDDGVPGRLAMVLAVCGGRGQGVDEAIAGLARSAAADGTRPAGTVWFMRSGDRARTGPRAWAFPAAVRGLAGLGIAARTADGVLPPSGAEVAGAVVGIAGFDWAASGARILPGAWCDHLTSFGGALQPDAGQTPLTAWLRAGAAGSGGAVGEPWAFPSKFPSPFLHQHRVEGLSLVEAVHRTLAQPFQYLAVGDPLSRPWGHPVAVDPPRPPISLAWEASLPITVAAVSGRIAVRHLGREVAAAVAAADGARCVVPARSLGIGPQELRVHAADGRLMHAIVVDVLPPQLLPALAPPSATVAGAICPAGVLAQATVGGWADAAAPLGGEVDGLIEIRAEGLHQLSWSSARLLGIAWDGSSESVTAGAGSMPVSLARGWHRLRLRLAPGPDALEVRFGRHGTRPLAPADWRRPE